VIGHFIALLSVLAVQVGAPASPAPPAAEQRLAATFEPRLRFDGRERAREACTFDGTRWVCDPARLRAFNIRLTGGTNFPASIPTVAEPLSRSPGCVVALQVVIKPTESVTVDWQKSSLAIDGVAHPVIPGFTKKHRVDQAPRSSVVPAGVHLVEQVFTGDLDDELKPVCMNTPGRDVKIDLNLFVARTNGADSVVVSFAEETLALSEAEAFGLLAEPVVFDAPEPEESFPWLFGVGLPGIGVAAIGAVVTGAGFTLLSNRATSSLGCGLCIGGCITATIGAIAAPAGFGLELSSTARAEAEKQAWEESQESHARRDAYFARRRELGLDQPLPQAH
jgi:hypothetical protein